MTTLNRKWKTSELQLTFADEETYRNFELYVMSK